MSAPLRTLEDGSPACRLIAWEVTRSCNLACQHCRAEAHPEPYPGELSTAEAKALIDTFPQVGNPIIIFTGGDPMMRPARAKPICMRRCSIETDPLRTSTTMRAASANLSSSR